jgi:3-oxoadipate enol-lactonase
MGSSADAEVSLEAMDAVVEVIEQNGVSPVVEDVLYFMLGDTTLNDPDRAATKQRVTKMLESRTPDYAHSVWNIAHRSPVTDELANIGVPVLVVAGDEDHTYPPDHSQRIVDGIAGAKYELMTQTGHVHAVERPDAVNALLKTHLVDTGF